MTAVLSFTLAQTNQQLAQSRTLIAIETALRVKTEKSMAESIRDRANSVGRDSHPRSVDPNDARDGTYREKIGDGYHHVYLFDSARHQSGSEPSPHA
jgi:hypothetical protein